MREYSRHIHTTSGRLALVCSRRIRFVSEDRRSTATRICRVAASVHVDRAESLRRRARPLLYPGSIAPVANTSPCHHRSDRTFYAQRVTRCGPAEKKYASSSQCDSTESDLRTSDCMDVRSCSHRRAPLRSRRLRRSGSRDTWRSDRASRSATLTHSLSLPGLSTWSTIACQTRPFAGSKGWLGSPRTPSTARMVESERGILSASDQDHRRRTVPGMYAPDVSIT